MEAWQERLVAEYEDLKEKFSKLEKLTEDEEAFSKLPREDQRLLLEQKVAMRKYRDILFERVRRL